MKLKLYRITEKYWNATFPSNLTIDLLYSHDKIILQQNKKRKKNSFH